MTSKNQKLTPEIGNLIIMNINLFLYKMTPFVINEV